MSDPVTRTNAQHIVYSVEIHKLNQVFFHPQLFNVFYHKILIIINMLLVIIGLVFTLHQTVGNHGFV